MKYYVPMQMDRSRGDRIMAGSTKIKLLYVMKILLEKTDDHHALSAQQIIEALGSYDIRADRKSIYADIETLREFGLDILQQKGSQSGYYIGGRDFELAELKLLVDAVQSSKFITSRKSEELIKKLEQLVSEYDAKELRRDVVIYNRPKTANESIYYAVDRLHQAIHSNQQIAFRYREWTVAKKMRLKKAGGTYTVSPWALSWADENYYLIAFDEEADTIKHYRVDKMMDIDILLLERQGKERFKDFDIATFSKKTFAMFGGQDEQVTLHCHNSLVNAVLDRFGTDVMLRPLDGEYFQVVIAVSVSPHFYGWLTAIGNRIEVIGPDWVQKAYVQYLAKIMKNYHPKSLV